jgi:hypothetical protein
MFTQDWYASYKLGLLKQQEFLQEAERERLVHLVKPQHDGQMSVSRRILARLRQRVVTSGKQQQERSNRSDLKQTDLCIYHAHR